ncbi:MAG TPA: Plug domain-containing protein, partial [Myxococcota bacterium]|nr:Plug domain-containing protein [Myxococcota bacterium]
MERPTRSRRPELVLGTAVALALLLSASQPEAARADGLGQRRPGSLESEADSMTAPGASPGPAPGATERDGSPRSGDRSRGDSSRKGPRAEEQGGLGVGRSSQNAAGDSEAAGVEELIVQGRRRAATAPTIDEARRRMERIPGAVGLVDEAAYRDLYVQSLGDALAFTPGVFADISAQRESRISIRGSGVNSSFERRGITVLRDGVPISRASGLTEFQEIDPISVDYIEVYKGANSLRYGGASLGGAIHIVSPTGRTRPQGLTLRAEGGSFST